MVTQVGSVVSTAPATGSSTFTVNLPGSILAGDTIAVGIVAHDGGIGALGDPSGEWDFQTQTTDFFIIREMYIYTKEAVGGETSVAFNVGSGYTYSATAIAHRGVEYGDIEAAGSSSNTGPENAWPVPIYVADGPGLQVGFWLHLDSGGDVTGVSEGGTLRSTTTAMPVIGTKPVIAAGSTTPPMQVDKNSPDYFGSAVLGYLSSDVPPDVPTLTTMTGGASYDRTVANQADHTFNDDNPTDSQKGFDLRYKLTSSGTWTTINQPTNTNTFYVFAANSLAAGNYERQVDVIDQAGNHSGFSASGFFTMGNPPATPTIVTPAADGFDVTGDTQLLDWTVTGTQVAYQVQVANGADYDTGEVTTNVTQATVPFPTNSVTRTMRVRYKTATNIWSAWASRTVDVVKVPPATPTIAATAGDLSGLGFNHAVTITPTNPAPSGGQPTVVSQAIYARRPGDTSDGVLIQGPGAALGAFLWYFPAAGEWEIRYAASSASLTSYSAWATVTVVIKGVVLMDPTDPDNTAKVFRFNFDGAADTTTREAALLEYQGREFPVVEYGDGTSRVIAVPRLDFKGSADAAALAALLDRRAVLHYRDARGRAVYGHVEQGTGTDTFYGSTSDLTVTVVDY